jgi:predicted Zn finger-like uncharacterized protein
VSGTTLCPHCLTRFRIADEQLEMHNGMVRCGHCREAFDARADFIADEPDPQLDLPILDEPVAPATASAIAEQGRPATLAERIELVADQPVTPPVARQWPWIIGNVALLLILLLQGSYFFRTELAVALPGLKPMLVSACAKLNCAVPLPRDTEQIGIESSSLEAHPQAPNQITLHALLRNHASHVLAYPALELSLNNLDDRPLARRILQPKDYLPADQPEEIGLAARRELDIALNLDIADLNPAGYRLFLFYPQ